MRDSDGARVSTADSDITVVLEASSGDGTLRGLTAGRASNGMLTPVYTPMAVAEPIL